MRRYGLLAAILVALFALCELAATPALAQNDPITRFFDTLFGVRKPQPVYQEIPQAAQPVKKKPAEPKIVEAPKNADARVVLVIGDAEAQGLAYGLQMAFADEPSIVVVAKTRAASGLTRDGDGEWSQLAGKILAENPADFIVAMVGVNDWQTIPVAGGKPLEIAGDDWNRVYGERLDRFLAAIRATGKPFWWVGLPPTADPDLGPTRRAAYAAFLSGLNDLARPRVQAAGGGFVDVWNAFTDEEGHYTAQGPDIDGQVKRLRANDGILFTRAGQRKLAYFVETEIRRLKPGEQPIPTTPEEPIAVAPKPEEPIAAGPPPLPPAPWATVGPVIPLDLDAPASETVLAGGAGARAAPTTLPGGYPLAATPSHRRLVEGLPIEPPLGRVDDITRRMP